LVRVERANDGGVALDEPVPKLRADNSGKTSRFALNEYGAIKHQSIKGRLPYYFPFETKV